MNGIFAVYKPVGMTSHDVVDRVRRLTGVKRVGHGGTLDPLASGVLVIAVGRENTKLLDTYVKGEKEYIATIKLGEVSDTDDAEGPLHSVQGKQYVPTRDDIERCIQKYVGLFPQMPPLYSAKKVGGRVAYKMARAGRDIKLAEKMVEIKQIAISSFDYPFLTIRVTCGSGVYIRSLARDIGRDLNVGGYLAGLERTKVGVFTAKEAVPFDQLFQYTTPS